LELLQELRVEELLQLGKLAEAQAALHKLVSTDQMAAETEVLQERLRGAFERAEADAAQKQAELLAELEGERAASVEQSEKAKEKARKKKEKKRRQQEAKEQQESGFKPASALKSAALGPEVSPAPATGSAAGGQGAAGLAKGTKKKKKKRNNIKNPTGKSKQAPAAELVACPGSIAELGVTVDLELGIVVTVATQPEPNIAAVVDAGTTEDDVHVEFLDSGDRLEVPSDAVAVLRVPTGTVVMVQGLAKAAVHNGKRAEVLGRAGSWATQPPDQVCTL
jgi:hypothetical protein